MLTAPNQQGDRAFAASLDADSEGEEGKLLCLEPSAEIDAVLGDDADFFKRALRRERRAAIGKSTPSSTARSSPALLDEAGEERLLRARQACWRRARSACGRAGTTRCWPIGTG